MVTRPWLQWGRGHVTAESCVSVVTEDAPSTFNGAAVT